MAPVTIPRGVWTPTDPVNGSTPEGLARLGVLAFIRCPSCNKVSLLRSSVHAVADDGTVTPSYVCPYPPCAFHEWVRLEGWPADSPAPHPGGGD
jgi:hypothetical protein